VKAEKQRLASAASRALGLSQAECWLSVCDGYCVLEVIAEENGENGMSGRGFINE